MTAVAERTDSWVTQFRDQKHAPAWMEQLRRSGFARFSALGFPTTRNEDWRFTNVAPIAKTAFGPAPAASADADALAPFTKGIRFVFVNGRLQDSPPVLPNGLTAGTL